MKYNCAESESALLDKEIWDGGISFINCILHLDISYFCMQKVNLSPTFEVQIQLLFISYEYHLLKAISRWRFILYSVTFYANRLQISRTFFVKGRVIEIFPLSAVQCGLRVVDLLIKSQFNDWRIVYLICLIFQTFGMLSHARVIWNHIVCENNINKNLIQLKLLEIVLYLFLFNLNWNCCCVRCHSWHKSKNQFSCQRSNKRLSKS